MTEVVGGYTEQICRWVAERIPYVDEFGPAEALAVVSGDKVVAGVVYHDYQPMYESIQLSMAADSPVWARPETIARLLQYPFEQLGCYRVWTITPIDNKLMRKTNSHIGFVQEAVCHSAFGKGRHGVIIRMLRPEYEKRYARLANGQVQT